MGNGMSAQRADAVVVQQLGCNGNGCGTPSLDKQMDPRLLAIPGFSPQLFAEGIERVNRDVFGKRSFFLGGKVFLLIPLGLLLGGVAAAAVCASGNCDQPAVACTSSGGMCDTVELSVPSIEPGRNVTMLRYAAATTTNSQPCCQFYCCGDKYEDKYVEQASLASMIRDQKMTDGTGAERDGTGALTGRVLNGTGALNPYSTHPSNLQSSCKVVRTQDTTPLGEVLPNHAETCELCTTTTNHNSNGKKTSRTACPSLSYAGDTKISGGEQQGTAGIIVALSLFLMFAFVIPSYIVARLGLRQQVHSTLGAVWPIPNLSYQYYGGSKHTRANLTVVHPAIAAGAASIGVVSAGAPQVMMAPQQVMMAPQQVSMQPMAQQAVVVSPQATMQVQVPAGASPGQILQAVAPDGQTIQFPVPAGSTPGQMITVATPAPVAAAPPVHMATVVTAPVVAASVAKP